MRNPNPPPTQCPVCNKTILPFKYFHIDRDGVRQEDNEFTYQCDQSVKFNNGQSLYHYQYYPEVLEGHATHWGGTIEMMLIYPYRIILKEFVCVVEKYVPCDQTKIFSFNKWELIKTLKLNKRACAVNKLRRMTWANKYK